MRGPNMPSMHQPAPGMLEALQRAFCRLPASAGLASRPDALRDLIDELEQAVELPRSVIGQILLAGSLQLSPAAEPPARRQAIDRALALLAAITGAQTLSLWRAQDGGAVQLAQHADAHHADAQRVARAALAGARSLLAPGAPQRHCDGETYGVRRAEAAAQGALALVSVGSRSAPAELELLLHWALAALAALVPAGGGAGDVTATERQLARLRFDLHDGPLQDVVLLAEDLRMFQGQLDAALQEHPLRRVLVGRLDDLKAMLVALDGDLRRICALLQSPFTAAESLPAALAQLTSAFAQRAEVIPEVELEGDFSGLSDSQRITLLSLFREALSNIREHSAADRVWITVRADDDGVLAKVTDNGRGFDPEVALVEAAREGHLGLVGMHERVRMLGGSTRIDSRPGGPTVIAVKLAARTGGHGETPFTRW